MNNFVEFIREDGTVEFRNPNYDALIAEAEATPPNTAVEISAEEMAEADLNSLRRKRDVLLAESDWTQAADSPLDDATKAEWATYRQALRDIPNTYSSLEDAVFPTKPE